MSTTSAATRSRLRITAKTTAIIGSIAVLLATPASNDVWATEPQVGVYYYPWWGDHTGGHYFISTLRDRLVPRQPPALGHYSSRNTAVILDHISQSLQGNISLWVTSWWGPGSAEDHTLLQYIMPLLQGSGVKCAIHYESRGRLGDSAAPHYGNLIPDFRHLADNYFSDPAYLRIDGKPVVVIYLTRVYFKDQPQALLEVDLLRQTIQDEYGYELYLVGDDFFKGNLTNTEAWDAITSYDVYGQVLGPPPAGYGSTAGALTALAGYYDDARLAAAAVGTAFIPTATPGFNDRGIRDGHFPAPRYMEDAEPSVFGSLFSRMLSDVVVSRVDPAAENILLINSFNEWHEDTQIEPTIIADPTNQDDCSLSQHCTEGYSYSGYGELYLDILREQTTDPLDDFAHFASCMTGPDGIVSANCEAADTDQDNDADLDDFAAVQRAFTGPT